MEYKLTPLGRTLLAPIEAFGDWASTTATRSWAAPDRWG
ncbi:hypothetical protein [Streptomyces sp. 8K308]